jgi:hypothetical protein
MKSEVWLCPADVHFSFSVFPQRGIEKGSGILTASGHTWHVVH